LAAHLAWLLLFDLGGVIIEIDSDLAAQHWALHGGCEPDQIQGRFTRDQAYERHERGEISDLEYFDHLRTMLGINVSDAEMLVGWNAIFVGEMAGISDLLRRLTGKLPLYAFSNTNTAHIDYWPPRFGQVLGHFEEVFVSPAIGLRKPEPESFDHVVAEIGVPANRVAFFDDLAENVEGARARGLKAFRTTSTDQISQALVELGF